jgi:hypothetical protein
MAADRHHALSSPDPLSDTETCFLRSAFWLGEWFDPGAGASAGSEALARDAGRGTRRARRPEAAGFIFVF